MDSSRDAEGPICDLERALASFYRALPAVDSKIEEEIEGFRPTLHQLDSVLDQILLCQRVDSSQLPYKLSVHQKLLVKMYQSSMESIEELKSRVGGFKAVVFDKVEEAYAKCRWASKSVSFASPDVAVHLQQSTPSRPSLCELLRWTFEIRSVLRSFVLSMEMALNEISLNMETSMEGRIFVHLEEDWSESVFSRYSLLKAPSNCIGDLKETVVASMEDEEQSSLNTKLGKRLLSAFTLPVTDRIWLEDVISLTKSYGEKEGRRVAMKNHAEDPDSRTLSSSVSSLEGSKRRRRRNRGKKT